ncbi:MAG: fumarylacetoacetate hydrolase family protein [Colwellia sp.]|nr:fumarylacetoacetate hydrolase family protein [Colwellia sp.]MCW9081343.1 fumarylacetoacetate hydrolase family protein [Colwellia sp.]
MKLLSFTRNGMPSYGALVKGGIIDLGARLKEQYPDIKSVIVADAFAELEKIISVEAADFPESEVEFLPVVGNPGKILCVGLNYESHRKETGRAVAEHPAIFTRFADTQIGHNTPIRMPKVSNVLDYEGEMAIVIGKGGRYISREDAMSHVAGYSCYNDATIRDWQRHTIQFTPGKNFPGTGAFGPYLVTPNDIPDPHKLSIQTRLNGEIMQDANTGMFIFDIPKIIEYISGFTALSPGDVIATGTPGGVGFKREPMVLMKPGDEVVVEIEHVGLLVNSIALEQ